MKTLEIKFRANIPDSWDVASSDFQDLFSYSQFLKMVSDNEDKEDCEVSDCEIQLNNI